MTTMRILSKHSLATATACLCILLCCACNKQKESVNPLKSTSRTYIVISDIHLGDERSIDEGYGWNISMKDTLMAFLDYIKDNKLCDELVLAGDIIDEWVAPTSYPAFADKQGNILTERDFFRSVINTNRRVLDKFQTLRNSGVQLVYIPGNHDMQVTAEDFASVLPGLFLQARSQGIDGMGEYRPTDLLYIEHGHRYDIMNAPYLGKNGVDGIQGSILPPGYFVSKLNCDSKMEAGDSKSILDNISYNVGWTAMGALFGHKDVATHTDGMTRTYHFEDYAYNTCKLFNGIDNLEESDNDGWKSRCRRLGAYVQPQLTESLLSGLVASCCDNIAMQVIESNNFTPRILVWGHSHEPSFNLIEVNGKQRLYVNTGCWVDGKVCGSGNNAWFCKITVSPEGKHTVSLCRFAIGPDGKGTITEGQKAVIL